jgi:peptidoglycan/xylan/chitin deacetylase (PgdA/CDA1 family)
MISQRSAKTVTNILERMRFPPRWMMWSSGKVAKKISIVMYHSVAPAIDLFSVSAEAFARQMRFIVENYDVVRLADLSSLLIEEEEGPRKVVVTFDDAFSHLLETAYPVLKKYSIPCTMFVPTQFIGGRNEWDLRENISPAKSLMTASDLSLLVKEGLVDIGSHSVDHVSMGSLTRQEMEKQAIWSKRTLEDLLRRSVDLFAYPFGQLRDFSDESANVLQRAGYKLAVTSHWGTLNTYKDRFKLRRIFFDESDSTEEIRKKLEGQYDWFAAKERLNHIAFLLRNGFRGGRSR